MLLGCEANTAQTLILFNIKKLIPSIHTYLDQKHNGFTHAMGYTHTSKSNIQPLYL